MRLPLYSKSQEVLRSVLQADPLLLEVTHIRDDLVLGAPLVIGQIGIVAERNQEPGGEIGNDESLAAFEHRTMACPLSTLAL